MKYRRSRIRSEPCNEGKMTSARTIPLMTPERWQQAKEILADSHQLDADEREHYLDEACHGDDDLRREVESLLGYEDVRVGIVEQPILFRLPRRIGPYKIERILDEGGMGTVALAVREDDFEKKVALKLVRRERLSEELLSRFHMERRILARLEHPNIATIFDGGTTGDGLPYFVMEYVEGEPIDQYCDARDLSTRQRLELFREVCSAVQVAHQNLVVHRDLKPGNILVTTEGKPKLLDFGIAKLLESDVTAEGSATLPGHSPMTVAFASPEQIQGEQITTATDVYSLGVLLFKLLTGELPYAMDSRSLGERQRVICKEEPDKPSTVNPDRRLAGDLDSIVLKALRKDRRNRYSSVERFSEDVRRYLAGLPVSAREGTFLYRAEKYVRRHWRQLSAAAVLLVASAVVTLRIVEAERAAQVAAMLARESDAQAEIRLDLLRNLFRESDLRQERSFPVRALLDRGEARIRKNLKDEPLASQLESLGRLYGKLGLSQEARVLLEDCLELRQRLYAGDHPLLAVALNNLAAWHYVAREFEKAEELYDEALAMKKRLRLEGLDLVPAMSNQASILMNRGEYQKAEELYRQALATRREALGPKHWQVAKSLLDLGTLFHAAGKLEHAEPLVHQAIEIRAGAFGEESTQVAAARSVLGRVLHGQGKHREAERQLNAVLALLREHVDEDHRNVALTKKALAAVLLHQGKTKAAGELLDESLGILRESMPEGDWHIADAESLLGDYLASQGRYEEAKPYLIDSYLALRRIRGQHAIYTRYAHRRLVDLHATWGRPLPDRWRPSVSTAQKRNGGL